MQVTEITRRRIFDALQLSGIYLYGRLDEINFLSRIWDLDKLPSYDSRFKNARGDIWQHTVNNDDWDNDWVFTDDRFYLLKGEDEVFFNFISELLHPVVRKTDQETENILNILNEHLSKDGFEVAEISRISGYPVYSVKKLIEVAPYSVGLVKNLEGFDTDYLRRQISRIEASITPDPDLAIGTSKELVETCCKTILDERGISIDKNWDLSQLVKATYKELKLIPDGLPDTGPVRDTVKKLLSNLASVTQGLAELRNHFGTGHGKSATSKGLTSTHARLAVGAATTLTVFLFETHKQESK
jgi:hypothetical protein